MRKIKIWITIIIMVFVVISLIYGCIQEDQYRNIEVFNPSDETEISVFLYRLDDEYISSVKESLEEIQAKNPGKVQFAFYDSKDSQSLQNENIDKAIKQGTDVLLVNLVDIGAAQQVINKIKENNLPVVLFNREPDIPEYSIKSYSRAYFVGTDAKEAGVLQGKIIIDEWNKNRINVDKNLDGILQYIMLTGERNNKEAIERTKYSVDTIKEAGIKTEEIALRVANWDQELAKIATQSLIFKYGDRIEAIIANNDAMAIGAIKALQESGYNKGDGSRNIIVVGVDAIEEAKELISKGIMTGTVIQEHREMAEAIYLIGMNLALGREPLEDTTYKFDKTGVSIRIPYKEYVKE